MYIYYFHCCLSFKPNCVWHVTFHCNIAIFCPLQLILFMFYFFYFVLLMSMYHQHSVVSVIPAFSRLVLLNLFVVISGPHWNQVSIYIFKSHLAMTDVPAVWCLIVLFSLLLQVQTSLTVCCCYKSDCFHQIGIVLISRCKCSGVNGTGSLHCVMTDLQSLRKEWSKKWLDHCKCKSLCLSGILIVPQ